MTDNSFPLRRLPLVPIREVSQLMSLRELFLLSLTSKKTRNHMKSTFPKHYIHASIGVWHDRTFNLERNHDKLEMVGVETENKDFFDEGVDYGIGSEVNLHRIDGKIQFIWGNQKDALPRLISHFSDTFNEPTISFSFGCAMNPNDAKEILDYLKALNLPLREITFALFRAPADIYIHFLNECKKIKRFYIDPEVLPGFRFRPASPNDFTLKYLRISDGHWVHLQDFMQCQHLVVTRKSQNEMICVNAQHLNRFFKKWLEEPCNLEWLEVRTHPVVLELPDIVRGLNGSAIVYDDLEHRVRIQRPSDGRKVFITLSPIYITMQLDFAVPNRV